MPVFEFSTNETVVAVQGSVNSDLAALLADIVVTALHTHDEKTGLEPASRPNTTVRAMGKFIHLVGVPIDMEIINRR